MSLALRDEAKMNISIVGIVDTNYNSSLTLSLAMMTLPPSIHLFYRLF